MDADETAVDVFTTRVRQMILQYKELKLQNAQLCSAIDALKADVSNLEEQLRKQREEYTNLKLARMVAITDGDMEAAQKRVSQLIRDVNKCIALISGKHDDE